MDGARFDDVARLIGTGASRRLVIKGALAGFLGIGGVSVVRRQVGAADAQGDCVLAGNSCEDDGFPCCGDSVCAGVPRICVDPSGCAGETGPCNTETGPDCCAGSECVVTDGFNGSCVGCSDVNDGCDVSEDCCGDLICFIGTCMESIPTCETNDNCPGLSICCSSGDSLFCVESECCGPDDPVNCDIETEFCTDEKICVLLEGRDECQEDSDCVEPAGEGLTPICCGGVCAQIECCTDDEDPNARCADGTSCFEGYCDPICSSDDDCGTDTCCCPDGTCSADCCDPTGPVDEPETPVVLPNTGIGGDSGNGALLGAGLLAAGAAYLAGKKLQTGDES